jgi:CubicO group peptidase (beta-lactamase class C family)
MRGRLPAFLIGLCLAGAAPAGAGTLRTLDGRPLAPAGIAKTVATLMAAADVKGLGVAIIRDGRVVYRGSFGLRNVAEHLPLEPDTIMYGASLTKATFAYTIMQLVDEGRVDLDRPIAAYLPRPLPAYPKYAGLAGDERWRRLTLRILLDHSSGFANFAALEPDHKLRFHWDPGTRFAYSGEGINLAQFVLEEGLGLDLGAEMQRRVFDRFGMKRTSLTWRDDFAANLAETYGPDGALVEHHHRGSVRAAGSMDTSLRDWSEFLAGVARGEGLSRRAKAEMVRRQIEIASATQFPSLTEATTRENRAIRLGYGLGWGVFETPYGHAFFKEGHDDGTANYAICVEPRRACLLLMSNSVRAEGIYKALVEALLGDVHMPWRWEGYTPFDAPH